MTVMTQMGRKTGTVTLVDNEIVLPSITPYDLPSPLTMEFVEKLFSYHEDDPRFIPVIASEFTTKTRERLFIECKHLGGNAWNLYRQAAVRWAHMTSEDGEWHMDKFHIVYEAEVAAPKIDRLAVSNRNIRLALSPLGWLTFPEFKWRYGETIIEHINKYIDAERGKVEQHIEVLNNISKIITSDLITKNVSMVSKDGVTHKPILGLSAIPVEKWVMPEGFTFLDVVDA